MTAALLNVARAALKPGRFAVMTKKALRRVADERGSLTADENLSWLDRHAVEFDRIAREMNPALLDEAQAFGRDLRARAQPMLATIGVRLGGSGFVELLYFLTRLRRPQCVVETGVAAGFSSQAVLAAMDRNGAGVLHSSDFPYFRLPNPERFVGVLVEGHLKHRWKLHLDGDEANLPKILADVEIIDLFHYDSDKSYAGRRRALQLIEPKCTPHTLIVMDDLQDGSFFHDYVQEHALSNVCVLRCGSKYVGVIGAL